MHQRLVILDHPRADDDGSGRSLVSPRLTLPNGGPLPAASTFPMWAAVVIRQEAAAGTPVGANDGEIDEVDDNDY